MTTTNNPTANPNLTDAECDAILHRSGVDVLLYRTAINDVDWTLYRSSQYASFDEAVRHGAIASERDVLGYFDAVDVISAIMSAIDLMDYRASEDDVRLPECALADSFREIDRHLVRQGCYTITSNN